MYSWSWRLTLPCCVFFFFSIFMFCFCLAAPPAFFLSNILVFVCHLLLLPFHLLLCLCSCLFAAAMLNLLEEAVFISFFAVYHLQFDTAAGLLFVGDFNNTGPFDERRMNFFFSSLAFVLTTSGTYIFRQPFSVVDLTLCQ